MLYTYLQYIIPILICRESHFKDDLASMFPFMAFLAPRIQELFHTNTPLLPMPINLLRCMLTFKIQN